jgi:hypothetical protein
VAANEQYINFVKLTVDQMLDITSTYGTQGVVVSVVRFFCDDKESGEVVIGYIPKDNSKKDIDKMVTSAPSCLANFPLPDNLQLMQFRC